MKKLMTYTLIVLAVLLCGTIAGFVAFYLASLVFPASFLFGVQPIVKAIEAVGAAWGIAFAVYTLASDKYRTLQAFSISVLRTMYTCRDIIAKAIVVSSVALYALSYFGLLSPIAIFVLQLIATAYATFYMLVRLNK